MQQGKGAYLALRVTDLQTGRIRITFRVVTTDNQASTRRTGLCSFRNICTRVRTRETNRLKGAKHEQMIEV